MSVSANAYLSARRLSVAFPHKDGSWLSIVSDLNLSLHPGKTLGLVGESGSGKSLTALSILRLLPIHAAYGQYSQVLLDHEDILNYAQFRMRDIRGKKVAMIFQEPSLALNPLRTMFQHLVDVIQAHQVMTKSAMHEYMMSLMDDVELTSMKSQLHDYPHQWSGGQKQRFLIAMALAHRPQVILADEPTTALDLVVQGQILRLLKKLQQQYGLAMLLISHDLAVIRMMADDILVMYAGQVIERSPRAEFWKRPLHPYVYQLLNGRPNFGRRWTHLSVIPGQVPSFYQIPEGCRFHPRCALAMDKCKTQLPQWYELGHAHQVRCHLYPVLQSLTIPAQKRQKTRMHEHDTEVLLEVCDLWVAQENRSGYILQEIQFPVMQRHVLAVVGESGSGKSTLALSLVGLQNFQRGQLKFAAGMQRSDIQLVFQDPSSAMNPRWLIQDILQEGGHADLRRIHEILDAVQMPVSSLKLYPHELSGGQRQRIAIARSLLASPKLLICDEPTSALDISVQAQILNLLQQLQMEMGFTYILITHDLDLVAYLADEILILKEGKMVEYGPFLEVWQSPKAEYTRSLFAACEGVEE